MNVYISPPGNLWLILKASPRCVALNLETAEERVMLRDLDYLVRHGWRAWDEPLELESARLRRDDRR